MHMPTDEQDKTKGAGPLIAVVIDHVYDEKSKDNLPEGLVALRTKAFGDLINTVFANNGPGTDKLLASIPGLAEHAHAAVKSKTLTMFVRQTVCPHVCMSD
jgi:hypothetical protein